MDYALIGCGRIAKFHVRAAIKCRLNIIALCDLDTSKAQRFIEDYHLGEKVRVYSDYKAMLAENSSITLVSIATESGSHARIALDVIAAGKHVMIEKPIALSMADADEIMRAGKAHNVKVSVCHQNRFNSAVQALRRAVDEGSFGRITHGSIHIRWNRGRDYYSRDDWRGTWEDDGGALMNQSIHGIDLLMWMMNSRVTSVYGVLRNFSHDYISAEDFGMALLQFENGSCATIEGTTTIFKDSEEACLCLYGINGSAKLGGLGVNKIESWNFLYDRNSDADEEIKNVYGNSHPRLFMDMISAVKNDTAPLVDAQAGKNALEVVLAIYRSFKEKCPVNLPLGDFSTLDMKGVYLNA